MIRSAALFLIAFCPIAAGFLGAKNAKAQIREQEGFLRLLAHIRYEISAFLTKQEQLFARFENAALEQNGFLPLLKAQRVTDAYSTLYTALMLQKDALHIGGQAQALLIEYARDLGRRDAEEECARAANTEAALLEIWNKSREESEKKVRLYRGFGVVAGLLFFLLAV